MPMLLAASDPSAHGATVVVDLLLVLAAAGVAGLLARPLRISLIAGYLIAGALIGPHALELVRSPENIADISHLAIILLMFIIGLHMDLSGVSGGMVPTLVVGVVSTVLSALAGWGVGVAVGLPAPGALAASMALAMSSTAVVVRMLQQQRHMHSVVGRLAFGILVVQDMLALAALALLPLLAAWAGAGSGAPGADTGADGGAGALGHVGNAALAIGAISALVAGGRLLLPRILEESAKERSGEASLVLAAAAGLGAAVVTTAVGLSAELGAFIAGFVLASTPFRHQLSGQLSPMRDLFMAVFFTTVGFGLDVRVLVDQWPVIAAGLVALLAIKASVIGGTAWALGATASVALAAGLALAQAGEFSLVILGVAVRRGVVPEATQSLLVALVVLSLVLTPSLYHLGQRLRPRLMRAPTAPWITASALREELEVPTHTPVPAGAPADGGVRLAEYVIIAGFGVVGRTLADRMEVAGIPFVIVDMNPATVRTQRRLGRSAVYGDVTNPEVLESAGMHRADAVFLTIPDTEAVLRACRVIRELAPHAFIATRTNFLSQAMVATQLGANHVTVEEVATAEMMQREVMQQLARRASRRTPAPPPAPDATPDAPPGQTPHAQ